MNSLDYINFGSYFMNIFTLSNVKWNEENISLSLGSLI